MTNVTRALERMRNTPDLGKDVLTVVILTVIGLICVGYMLSRLEWTAPWTQRFEFTAHFEKAPGVEPSALQEVRIAGVTVGRIEHAEPAEDGSALVRMSLRPGHRVYQDARVELRTKAPLNIMYVALDPGGASAEPLGNGESIPAAQSTRAIQPWEVLEHLDARTQAALTSLLDELPVGLADAPEELPGGLDALGGAMTAFDPVLEELATRRDLLASLVTSLGHVATAAGEDEERLVRLAGSMQSSLGVLAERDGELEATLAELPGFTSDLRSAMGGAGDLASELDPVLAALDDAAGDLPPALARLTDTVDRAGPLIAAARPVVRDARPVIADLRPLVADLEPALGDLSHTTSALPDATAQIVPWLDDLAAFVYQTSSSFSMADANGGLGRAEVVVQLQNPLGGGPNPPEPQDDGDDQ